MDPIPGMDDDTAAEWGLEIMLEAAGELEARGEALVDPVTGQARVPERVRRVLRDCEGRSVNSKMKCPCLRRGTVVCVDS
jgi:hypothetical protein